jgi:hypothetical protein
VLSSAATNTSEIRGGSGQRSGALWSQTCHTFRASVACVVTTAFGRATVAEQVTLKQRANGKQFATLVQLLEDDKGDWLVRFAYSTDGTARRGPVTLRGADLERLRVALRKKPRLRAALGIGD